MVSFVQDPSARRSEGSPPSGGAVWCSSTTVSHRTRCPDPRWSRSRLPTCSGVTSRRSRRSGRSDRSTSSCGTGTGTPGRGSRLTFDDDYVTHLEHVLPVLRALDAPATFFLSGRALHGLGSYWFELLEELIRDRGVGGASGLLHTRHDEVGALVAACENDPALQKVLEAEVPDVPRHLGRADIETLTGAGMQIGFHTLHHEIVTRLGDGELEAALTVGRRELEEIVGHPLTLFAYPHGKADRRTADKVRDVGYVAAWTGRPQAMQRGGDRYLLGRWEPGRLDVDDLLVGSAIRLTR